MNKLKFWPFLLLISLATQAQQLDKIGKKGGVQVSGGLGLTNQFYAVSGESNALTPPYSYMLSGNVNINAYGWALPFSIVYTNRKFVTDLIVSSFSNFAKEYSKDKVEAFLKDGIVATNDEK